MDDGAGAPGDVLARHVLDVTFERVLIRIAVARGCLEVELQLSLCGQRRALGLEWLALAGGFAVAAADERKPRGRIPVHHWRRRAVHRRARKGPRDGAFLHRRAE